MGLVPIPSVLILKKSRNKSTALAETNDTLPAGMPLSDIQFDDLVINSKKLEGMPTLNHAAKNMLLAPIKYSLFDKFKGLSKDSCNRKEQWVCMNGTLHGTRFSDLCKAGKLSLNFNRNYEACIPKHSGRSQRSTKLLGYCRKQADLCFQDVVPGFLCIGGENSTSVFDPIQYPSDSLVTQNRFELEIPSEQSHTPPFEKTMQFRDAAETGHERELIILSQQELLHWRKLSSSLEITSSSSDTPRIPNMEDLNAVINKSEQDSPVSVLEAFFEDTSPCRSPDATSKPAKPPLPPRRISFEERSPVKRVKLHSDTITETILPSKNHTSSALEYTRKVLELSDLNWYKLALNRHCSTQMLDSATYTKMNPHSTSQTLTSSETRMLFDLINEVLTDTYHHYHGFYHHLTVKNFFNDIIKTVEMNIVPKQNHVPEQKLVIDGMEKCGTWMDSCRELEDIVMEIAEELADEVVEEFMFEMWID